jgi:transcriptional regulator with XRE-family HTH domain
MGTRYDFERLRVEALARGMTQAAIAKRARITQQRVSSFLTGQRQSPSTAAKIARALGVELRQYVVTESEVA